MILYSQVLTLHLQRLITMRVLADLSCSSVSTASTWQKNIEKPCALGTQQTLILRLQRLVNEHEGDDLSQLPNFAYSTRLAEFREDTGHTADKEGRGSGFAPGGLVDPSATNGDLSLEQRLAQAVMLYPVVVVRLMEK